MRNDFCCVAKGAKKSSAGAEKPVLTSKSQTEIKTQRKPIKECYCISEDSKSNKKSPGVAKKISSDNYLDNDKLIEIYSCANTARHSSVRSLPGYETLRRAGRITYPPNSEFLQRVQKRVHCHRRRKARSPCLSTSSSEDIRLNTNLRRTETADCSERLAPKGEKIDSRVSCRACGGSEYNGRVNEPRSVRSRSLSLENREKANEDRKIDVTKGKPRASRKITHSMENLRKDKPKKLVRTISAHHRCCLPKNAAPMEKSRGNVLRQKIVKESHCDCENTLTNCETNWRLSRDRLHVRNSDSEERVKELSQFRRANYFETHGSVISLVGCRSSLSSAVEGYRLNNHVFEAPRCLAKQSKKIHYYPSYVVREERPITDTNLRKKVHCPNLETTGHIVDLGILKIPCGFSSKLAFNCNRRDY